MIDVWSHRIVGVIGGMGPKATLDFLSTMLRLTSSARTDQDHVPTLVYNDPRIPDRNMACSGAGPSPEPMLIKIARSLESAGADCLVMPCNTAHIYASAIRRAISIPFIDMIEATCDAVTTAHSVVRAVGLLATPGCTASGLYTNALATREIALVTLSEPAEKTLIEIIYAVKAGRSGSCEQQAARRLAMELIDRGAGAIISACTELPMVLKQADLPCPLIESTYALAKRSISYAKHGF
jgi:aspartate racemase